MYILGAHVSGIKAAKRRRRVDQPTFAVWLRNEHVRPGARTRATVIDLKRPTNDLVTIVVYDIAMSNGSTARPGR